MLFSKNPLTPNCTDRFATGKFAPILDTSLNGTEDLTEIEGNLTNDTIKFTFSRNLTTNDSHDYQIEQGKEINVLFSFRKYGNPEIDKGLFLQHTQKSGIKLILFPKPGQTIQEIYFLKDPSISKMSLNISDYLIPNKTTTYICKNYNITNLAAQASNLPERTPFHAIAFNPIIDNLKLVHHLVIFSCDKEIEIA